MLKEGLRCRLIVAAAVVFSFGVNTSSLADDPRELPRWNPGGGEQDAALRLLPNLDHGREVYKICAPCHLPEGWGVRDGTFPQIAGQHAEVIIKQLADIRAWNRDNPVMAPFAQPEKLGGVQSIADVAAYIEQLKMNPQPERGPGIHRERGAIVYQSQCQSCHGERGEGDAAKFYPRIQGQHYGYLTRQFEAIAKRERRNAHPEGAEVARKLSPPDRIAVLDYVSHLPTDPELVAPLGWQNPDFDE